MDQPLRQAIRTWLEQPDQLATMVDTIDRGRPPLEALDHAFAERFGITHTNGDKQQVGTLVRETLADRGFTLHTPVTSAEVPCRNTRVFRNASRYQRLL